MRVGIIGCGKIAQIRHIPEYSENPQAELAGYYDFNLERAEELAKRYGGKAYTSVEEMLADGTIDAVSVCVANNAHAEISLKALNAGKHVLCEKPMATVIEDCEAMVKAAKENNRYLMIGQNQRMARAHVKAKELLQNGAIGKIITFRTTFGHSGPETWSIDGGTQSWFFDKTRASMGAMADLGVHKTDLIQYLTDGKVTSVQSIVTTLDKKYPNGELVSVDDNAICIYQLDNGVLGTMTASWTYYGQEDNSTVIYGTDGIMKIYENPQYSIEVIHANGEKTFYALDKIQTNDNQTKSGIIDEFVEAVTNNREPSISGSSVLAAMRAVFASMESSKTGRKIEINQED